MKTEYLNVTANGTSEIDSVTFSGFMSEKASFSGSSFVSDGISCLQVCIDGIGVITIEAKLGVEVAIFHKLLINGAAFPAASREVKEQSK